MKNLVCVFAHPDDEAFGVGGTIAKLSRKYNIYLLCATKGEAEQFASFKTTSKNLAEIRTRELLNSAKILGVKKVLFLGFKDGTLSNNLYHELSSKISSNLKKLKPEIVITFEPRGITGHIDHITVSMATMFAVQKLKFVKEVWQVCKPYDKSDRDYFVYFPPGYKRSEIQKVVNVKDVWDKKLAAMKEHKSQILDFDKMMDWLEKLPREEYFLVVKP